jgi:hypothetical protein
LNAARHSSVCGFDLSMNVRVSLADKFRPLGLFSANIIAACAGDVGADSTNSSSLPLQLKAM